jgi:hypothetical protein
MKTNNLIRWFRLIAILFLFVHNLNAQIIFTQPLSPRIAEYNISVQLDAGKKTLDGKEILKWKNTSPDIIGELQFHLYLNAFKNSRSTFVKESGGQLRSEKMDQQNEKSFGWIDITSIKRTNGADLTKQIKFIQPDDNNKDDQTVISVQLDKPLRPGEEIELRINFNAKLPKIFARTGYADDYFLVGQWFPKIGVYEYPGIRYAQKGGWNCHQFHANSEFYADYAVFDVNIDVPSSFIVGAVGVLQSMEKKPKGRTIHHYHAEDVIDFAWTASPQFKVVTDQWRNVKIKLMLQPEHFEQAERHFYSVKASLEYFDKFLGKYPYPNLTIVDPPLNGFGSGGMEYPTFITAGTIWKLPNGVRVPEIVTVHEFGHNYFMGLLASNEFEEAFLDEGFNQYFETRIMDNTYGLKTGAVDIFGIKVGDFDISRYSYTGMPNPKVAEIYRKSWEYTEGGYGSLTYMKTATMLKTLEGLVGTDVMNEIMKTYYVRWSFKHPCVKDFIAIVNEVTIKNLGRKFGDNMNWYFDQVLYGSDVCDYSVVSISNNEIPKKRGIFDKEGKKNFVNGLIEGTYKSSVVIYRKGEVKLPVEILITFSDGKKVVENWDGQARTKKFEYECKSKIVSAQLDPFFKIPLDINIINNSLTVEPETGVFKKYAAKFFYWLENAMLTVSMLF